MRISLCMITRDEERNLDRCLSSVQGAVEEVCIVDTGSRDRTIEVAQRHGAKVAVRLWDDDFAAARNASLQLVTGDWALVLDADEVLAGDPRQALQQLRVFASAFPNHAGHVTMRDRDVPGAEGEVFSHVTRFFPMNLAPEFHGKIHEQLTLAGETPLRAHTGVEFVHFGYSKSAMDSRGKARRNILMLRDELRTQPHSVFLWYQLGLTHLVGGDLEPALKALTTALAYADTAEPYIAHLSEALAYALRGLGQFEAGHQLVSELLKSYPNRADTVFLHSLLSMDLGLLDHAEHGFRRCLELYGTQPIGGAFTPAATTVGPAHNLGVLFEVTGELETARKHYELALKFDARHAPSLAALRRIATVATTA